MRLEVMSNLWMLLCDPKKATDPSVRTLKYRKALHIGDPGILVRSMSYPHLVCHQWKAAILALGPSERAGVSVANVSHNSSSNNEQGPPKTVKKAFCAIGQCIE